MQGKHTWGVILLRPRFSVGRFVEELMLVWFATTAEEWFDRVDVIPYATEEL